MRTLRTLLKQPRFTVVASLTLALGIGAVVAIFSVVNGVLLKSLPYPNADRLVNVWSQASKLGYDQFPLSPDLYFTYERSNQVFESMALFQRSRMNLASDAAPDVVDGTVTTHTYFPTLGVSTVKGRPYGVADDTPNAARVVVLSHRAWTQRFGSDEKVVGKVIRLDGQPVEVIGVADPRIDQQGTPDFYLPARLNRETPIQGAFGWNSIARLKPGVSPDDAASHLATIVRTFMEALNSNTYRAFLTDGGYRPRIDLMKEDLVGELKRPLWILLGTVGMLLLVACANVTNLFLVRAEGRQREIAVRGALGASRGELVRLVMAEALTVSALGCALGLGAAALGVPALLQLAPPTIPRLDQVGLDLTVVLFAVGAALLSALVVGFFPAIRYTRPASMLSLRHGGRGGTDDPARRRTRNVLVVLQTAIALVLLVGSGLLARSFSRLLATDPGFDPANVMAFRVALPSSDYRDGAAIRQFVDQLTQRLRELPAVESAGATTVLPIAQNAPGFAREVEGRPIVPDQLPPMIHYKVVARGYFDTMKIPIQLGRDFHSGDTNPEARSLIVNEALAKMYWPGQDAIGKRIRPVGGDSPQPWHTVVGVVGDERQDGLREPVRPMLFYGMDETLPGGVPRVYDFVVRGAGITSRSEELRQAVWAIDRGLPIASMRSMEEVVSRSIVEFTFTMLTLGIAAGIALLLGAVGLYGVLSYVVTLRTREIGVRLALGASPGRVMRSVVANGVLIAGIGLIVGLAGAVALTRYLGNLLFGVEPIDLATFAAMSAALGVVALVSSFLPARRAALVSPAESMKTD